MLLTELAFMGVYKFLVSGGMGKCFNLLLLVSGFSFSSGAKALDLQIIHMNDTHSHFDESTQKINFDQFNTKTKMGGFERLYQRVIEKRVENNKKGLNTLVFHGGDAFQGTLYFTQNKGQMNAKAWNLMELDAMALGNHEFDIGSKHLSRFLKAVDFPVLSANIDVSKNQYLKNTVKPYIIKTIAKVKVGIIGLSPENLRQLALVDKTIIISKEIEAARKIVSELQAKGVKHIIVLDHIGYENDLKLAENVKGIDAIVGGHSHTLLGDFKANGLDYAGPYPKIIENKFGEKVCIVQAWQYMRTLGEVKISFDSKGRLSSCVGKPELLLGKEKMSLKTKDTWKAVSKKQLKEITNIVAKDKKLQFVRKNQKATEFMKPYKKNKEAFGDKVIAYAGKDFVHSKNMLNLKLGDKFKNKSEMARLVADSYLYKAKSINKNVVAALVNGGGVRSNISQGHVRVNDVYEVLPFANELYIFEIKGNKLKKLISKSLNSHSGLPALSGLDLVFKKTKKGIDVENIYFKSQAKNSVAIKDDETYTVVTIDFLFKGGDGYNFSEANLVTKSGILDNEAFYEYLTKKFPKK